MRGFSSVMGIEEVFFVRAKLRNCPEMVFMTLRGREWLFGNHAAWRMRVAGGVE